MLLYCYILLLLAPLENDLTRISSQKLRMTSKCVFLLFYRVFSEHFKNLSKREVTFVNRDLRKPGLPDSYF